MVGVQGCSGACSFTLLTCRSCWHSFWWQAGSSRGMEFDSISIAKAFYYTYSENIGFKARTGSGRRSRGNRILVMQRFLCSKSNYPHGNLTDGCHGKKKRGPYKKRNSKLCDEGNVDEAVQTLKTASILEKAGITEDEMCIEGQNIVSKGASLNEKDDRKNFLFSELDMVNHVSVGMDVAKVPLTGNPAQSRLLREFGIRVSRYTHEERRDIIRRYMRKRSNRQVVDRSTKVPSRQALAERRQRGLGGKFLSKEKTEMQAINKQHETMDEDPELPAEVVAKAGGVPMVGMGFESEEKAYEYYVSYAASTGFSVRKGWWDKSAKNITRSRVYVCSREGFRPKSANEVKKSRPEIRTGCPARMAIKTNSCGRYRVTEFFADHNHQLAAPLDIQLLKSQKLLSFSHCGNHRNADLIPTSYKNYIRAKRVWTMKVGDSGAILQYLQKMKVCNPSFYYALQVDEDDKMTNVFWADAKSLTDYYYFGDVVCLDRSYKIDDFVRPLVLFVGVNHHKQAVIFGSAFLCDETTETFKWLFDAFKSAVGGKQPKTIFIDQFMEFDDVIEAIWPGTSQRLCTWQIYQHAFKQLGDYFQASNSFDDDFSRCLFDFEDEEEFLDAWSIMLEKYNLKENEWLEDIYKKKEKWSPAYGRDIFCADLQTTMRMECLNNTMKEWLNKEADISHFFKQYERLLEEKRYAELQADYLANQGTPRILPLRMLWQAANMYTPAMFDVFRREFELSMNCAIYNCGEVGTLSQYKELPQNYILKRWRKDAKVGSTRENQVLVHDEDSKSSITSRYKSLCRILYRIAERAAENIDSFTLLVGQSDQLIEQVERALQTKLLEKPPLSNALKGQLHNPVETKISSDDNNSDALKVNGKKRKEAVARHRQQSVLEVNKRNKKCKVTTGQVEHCDVAPGDIEPPLPSSDDIPQTRISSNQFIAPSHFVQGPYITGHQFGLPTTQGFHAMTQFGQVTVPGYPTPEMHALQFIGSNPQLDQQGSDQGHCNIPVWDFL
ncbi:hypothetical protein HPP92_028548 [Vanilla planifolia]|uniref:Protein FAR1-RELATED SEQUENCE n=1 Tax=Vanilla planifolia TaxID=51239 RepID=A0A835P5A4_VANPL|nr:hypothetical protein HPP92_028548 [Vanilla planifolia]